jgi:hypothetical protein
VDGKEMWACTACTFQHPVDVPRRACQVCGTISPSLVEREKRLGVTVAAVQLLQFGHMQTTGIEKKGDIVVECVGNHSDR